MNSTKTKPQATPVEVATNDRKSSTFERLKWTPENLSFDATVSARQMCRLVDHVKDVSLGVTTILELITHHDQQIEQDDVAYLSPYHLSALRQLAIRSLGSLDDQADEIATQLHNLSRGKA